MSKKINGVIVTDGNVNVNISVQGLSQEFRERSGYDPDNPYTSLRLNDYDAEYFASKDKQLNDAASIIAEARKIRTSELTDQERYERTADLIKRYDALISMPDSDGNFETRVAKDRMVVAYAVEDEVNRTIRWTNRHTLSTIEEDYVPTDADKAFAARMQNTIPYSATTADTLMKAFDEYRNMSADSREYVLDDLRKLYQEYKNNNIDREVQPELYKQVTDSWQGLPKRFSHDITFDTKEIEQQSKALLPEDLAVRERLYSIDPEQMSSKQFKQTMSELQELLKTEADIEKELTAKVKAAHDKTVDAEDQLALARGLGTETDIRISKAAVTRAENAEKTAVEALSYFQEHRDEIISGNYDKARALYSDYMKVADEFVESHPRSAKTANAMLDDIRDAYANAHKDYSDFLQQLQEVRKHDAFSDREANAQTLQSLVDKFHTMDEYGQNAVRGPLLESLRDFNGMRLEEVQSVEKITSLSREGIALSQAVRYDRNSMVYADGIDAFEGAAQKFRLNDQEMKRYQEFTTETNGKTGIDTILEKRTSVITEMRKLQTAQMEIWDKGKFNELSDTERKASPYFSEWTAIRERYQTLDAVKQALNAEIREYDKLSDKALVQDYMTATAVRKAEQLDNSGKPHTMISIEDSNGVEHRVAAVVDRHVAISTDGNLIVTEQPLKIQMDDPNDNSKLQSQKYYKTNDAFDSNVQFKVDAHGLKLEVPVSQNGDFGEKYAATATNIKQSFNVLNIEEQQKGIQASHTIITAEDVRTKEVYKFETKLTSEEITPKTTADVIIDGKYVVVPNSHPIIEDELQGQCAWQKHLARRALEGKLESDNIQVVKADTVTITSQGACATLRVRDEESKQFNHLVITDLYSNEGKATFGVIDTTTGQRTRYETSMDYVQAAKQFDVQRTAIDKSGAIQRNIENVEHDIGFIKKDDCIIVAYRHEDKMVSGQLLGINDNDIYLRHGPNYVEKISVPSAQIDLLHEQLQRTDGIVSSKNNELYVGDGMHPQNILHETLRVERTTGSIMTLEKEDMMQRHMQIESIGDKIQLTYDDNKSRQQERIIYIQAEQTVREGQGTVDLTIVTRNGNDTRVYDLSGFSNEEFRNMLKYDKLSEAVSKANEDAWTKFRSNIYTNEDVKVVIDTLNNAHTPAISIDKVRTPDFEAYDILRAELVEKNGQLTLKGVDKDGQAVSIDNPIITRNQKDELIVYSVNDNGERDEYRIARTAAGKYTNIVEHAQERDFDYSRVISRGENAICSHIEKERTVVVDVTQPSRDLDRVFQDKLGISAELPSGAKFTPDMVTLDGNSKFAERYGVIIQETDRGPSFTYVNQHNGELLAVKHSDTLIKSENLPDNGAEAKKQGYVLIDRINNVAVKDDDSVYKIVSSANEKTPPFEYQDPTLSAKQKAELIQAAQSQTEYLKTSDLPTSAQEATDKKFLLVDYEKGLAIRDGGLVYAIHPRDLRELSERVEGLPKNYYNPAIATPAYEALKDSQFVAPEQFHTGTHDKMPMVNNWSIEVDSKNQAHIKFAEYSTDSHTTMSTIGQPGYLIDKITITEKGDAILATIKGDISHDSNSTGELTTIRLGRPTMEQLEYINAKTSNIIGNAGDRLQYWFDEVNKHSLSAGADRQLGKDISTLKDGNLVIIQDDNKHAGHAYMTVVENGQKWFQRIGGGNEDIAPRILNADAVFANNLIVTQVDVQTNAWREQVNSRTPVYAEVVYDYTGEKITGVRMGQSVTDIQGETHIDKGRTYAADGYKVGEFISKMEEKDAAKNKDSFDAAFG